jgi:hypothetical protein
MAEPLRLNHLILVAVWPGIGNVALSAATGNLQIILVEKSKNPTKKT